MTTPRESRSLRAVALAHAFPRDEHDPVGLFVLQLARALQAQSIETHVVAPSAAGLAAREVLHGVPVRRYRYAPRPLETLAYTGTMGEQVRGSWSSRIGFAGLLFAGLRAAASEARRIRADLIHAHWWIPGGLVGIAASRLTRAPLITTMHGSDVRLLGGGGAARLFGMVARGSSELTAVSTWLADAAGAVAGRPVHVAPMPVSIDAFPAGATRREPRLLFVGKLTEQKGLRFLLEALARCASRPTLEVVGAGRVDDAGLRARAADLGLADRITWTPILPQAELARRYRESAALVIPAIDEGLGLTAVEAALSETPVIAFASGGLVDGVVDGETGILVPPGDVPALAAAIDALMTDPARARRLGAGGRSMAIGRFGEEAVAARYAELYRRVVEG